MANMIRKQIYLRPGQDRLLKEMVRKTGISEAEYIREALERYLTAGSGMKPDPSVWQIEQDFIEKHRTNPTAKAARVLGNAKTFMIDKAFVDTSVLVYAYDAFAPAKQKRANEVLARLALTRTGFLSCQVLSEFFTTVTGKIPAPLSTTDAFERVANFLQVWRVLDLTGLIVLEAGRGVREHQLNYWDALIWASARLNQIPLILSEDFSDKTLIDGVRFLNPFHDGFDLSDL